MAGVRLTNVTKRFANTTVVENLSLSIEPGEFVVVLGPSGCGKSTVLRLIAGLETLDEGEIVIGEDRVDQLPPGRRDVAMVFQHYALYPHMTVRDNLAFGLRNVRTPPEEIETRIAAAAKSLEIGPLLDRRPGQLSGGQRQRVAIARAIVKEPSVFLFDEPLSNLDAALRGRTRLELAELHRRLSATMIFVTHDQVEAMTLSDRMVVMNNRRIEQVGAPMEIYQRPATQFVASFVGSPSINLLPADIAPGEDGMARVALPGGGGLQTGVPLSTLPNEGAYTVGLRPEHVRIATNGTAPDLRGAAQVVERLGERTLVHVKLPGGAFIVAEDVGSSLVQPGDEPGLIINGGAAHLFDADGRGYHTAASQ